MISQKYPVSCASGDVRTRNIFIRSAFLWSVGNTLTSNLVMLSLAFSLQFDGLTISLLLMVPWLAGALRPFSLPLLDRVKSKKRFCILGYLLQMAALIGVAWCTWPGNLSSHSKVWTICGFWSLACLCEHCVYPVLLAWNRDFVPKNELGIFFGKREFWKLFAEIGTLMLTIALTRRLKADYPHLDFLPLDVLSKLYVVFTVVGCLFLLFYLICLMFADAVPRERDVSCEISFRHTISALVRPFQDRKFLWLLAYGVIFAFFTQFDQVFQKTLPRNLMGIECGYQFGAISLCIVRLGQCISSRFVGRWVDRFGTLRVMMFSQVLTAFGILAYAGAALGHSDLLYLAPFLWICYIGLNVGLPKIQLEIASDSDRASAIAAYGAVTGLTGAVGILFGGYAYGFANSLPWIVPAVFILSFAGRLLCGVVLYVFRKRVN